MEYIIALFAISGFALLAPLAKKLGDTIPPFAFMSMTMFFLFIFSGVLAFIFEREKFSFSLEKNHWISLLLFSLVNLTAFASALWVISRIPIAQYQIIGVLTPVAGGLFAIFLLKEPFHIRYLISLAIITVGLYVALAPDLFNKEKM